MKTSIKYTFWNSYWNIYITWYFLNLLLYFVSFVDFKQCPGDITTNLNSQDGRVADHISQIIIFLVHNSRIVRLANHWLATRSLVF